MELMQRRGTSGGQAAAAAAMAEPDKSLPREDSQASDASAAGVSVTAALLDGLVKAWNSLSLPVSKSEDCPAGCNVCPVRMA